MRRLVCLIALLIATQASADIATLRKDIPLSEESESPARLGNPQKTIKSRQRAYPMQPPIIPHNIDGYQVDLNANRCLSCHARVRTGESLAPMISVTHFMDRDGNFLADVSPRRYFCTQCHVPQLAIDPIVDNNFTDIDELRRDD